MAETQNANLSKIIKRLELIKNLIALEEDEEIAQHINKLQKQITASEIENILTLLQEKQYGIAVAAIDKFIFEAKGLEREIQELSNEKAELDKKIHEFSIRHNQELGDLILKILQYRKQQYKDTPQQKETEKDYEDFYNDYQTTKDEKLSILTEGEQKEIKEKYRKASKLCHPDVVNDEQKEMAHKIFMELKEAYEKSDLKRVEEILETLQKGKAFTSKADTSNEKLALQNEIERLRQRLKELNTTLNNIKTSVTFETITNIKDFDEYFAKIKQKLQEQLNEFENGG